MPRRSALLVFGLLLLACSGAAEAPVSAPVSSAESPVSTTPPAVPRAGSEQTPETPDEEPQAALPVLEIEWQRAVVERDAEYPGVEWLFGVESLNTGFVAVDEIGRVLVSEDGLTWEDVAAGEQAFTTEGQLHFTALVATEAQILIVGGEVQPDGEDVDAAVWISADGRTWERVPHDEAVFGGPGWQGMRAVTWTGDRFVAVGHDIQPDTEQSRVAVWASPDGKDWERLPHDPDSFEAPEELEVVSVSAGPLGIVAVGRRGTDGAVWYSPDTEQWELLSPMREVFGGDDNQVVWDVLPVEEGFLAVGGTDPGAAVWWSEDGRSWRLVGRFGGGSIRSVTSVPDGFVGVGVENMGGGLRAAVWTSRDGLSWHRIPQDEAISGGAGNTVMYDVASSGNTVVAVGFGGIWVGHGARDN